VELGTLLIPVLIVLSGAIALVGNAVGRNIGRRRLSLLGLRPRYTAQVITILTGMLITVTTLLVVLALSQDARVALLQLNKVLRETQRLEAEIKRQEERLQQLALGDIAYLTNQEVVRDVIDGGLPSRVVRQRVLAAVERGTELARENGIGVDSSGNRLVLTPPNVSWEVMVNLVDQRDKDTVFRIIASQNNLTSGLAPLLIGFLVFAIGLSPALRPVETRPTEPAAPELILQRSKGAKGLLRPRRLLPAAPDELAACGKRPVPRSTKRFCRR